LRVVVDGERDAAAQEGQVDGGAALIELQLRQGAETLGEPPVVGTDIAPVAGGEHLIKEGAGVVVGLEKRHRRVLT